MSSDVKIISPSKSTTRFTGSRQQSWLIAPAISLLSSKCQFLSLVFCTCPKCGFSGSSISILTLKSQVTKWRFLDEIIRMTLTFPGSYVCHESVLIFNFSNSHGQIPKITYQLLPARQKYFTFQILKKYMNFLPERKKYQRLKFSVQRRSSGTFWRNKIVKKRCYGDLLKRSWSRFNLN